jgi:hypothetical protein
MDETTPLRQSGELSIPPPSNETGNNTHTNSLNEAQAPSSSSSNKSTPSSIPNLMNILPREIRDYIYELTFAENNLVVFGRRGILPEAHEGPKHPETTSQMISKYDQVIYPGTHSPFGTQDADNTSKNTPQTVDYDYEDPQHAELSAYGASVRKSLRWYDPATVSTSEKAIGEAAVKPLDDSPAIGSDHQNNDEANEEAVIIKSSARKTNLIGILLASKRTYEEAAPFLYKSCTFFFEDFEFSTKFLKAVSPGNLKRITKIMVYYPQDAEGTMKAITAIGDCPDLGGFYPQSNVFAPDAEARLKRALVSFDADPNDDYALAYNIAAQGSKFYASPADPTIPVARPNNLFPSRWLFGVMCQMLVVSISSTTELTLWIGDTLDLEFNSRRDEVLEAALLHFAALGKIDGGVLSVKKWGELFDNSNDQDAKWHETNWMKIRTLNGVDEMIRTGEHGALDRHALRAPDADE